MTLNTGVLDGPGLPLLIELEQCGFDLDVRRGELWVRPVEQLSTEQRASIQHHRDELVTLVRCCDDGVQERLAAFKQQLMEVPEGSTPERFHNAARKQKKRRETKARRHGWSD